MKGGGKEGKWRKFFKKEIRCAMYMWQLLMRNAIILFCKHGKKNFKKTKIRVMKGTALGNRTQKDTESKPLCRKGILPRFRLVHLVNHLKDTPNGPHQQNDREEMNRLMYF